MRRLNSKTLFQPICTLIAILVVVAVDGPRGHRSFVLFVASLAALLVALFLGVCLVVPGSHNCSGFGGDWIFLGKS